MRSLTGRPLGRRPMAAMRWRTPFFLRRSIRSVAVPCCESGACWATRLRSRRYRHRETGGHGRGRDPRPPGGESVVRQDLDSGGDGYRLRIVEGVVVFRVRVDLCAQLVWLDAQLARLRFERFGGRLRRVVLLAPARKHLDGCRDDLGLPVADLSVVLPLARLDPALDGDQLALAQVLGADLREAVPCDNGVVLRLLLAAAVVVGRHAE